MIAGVLTASARDLGSRLLADGGRQHRGTHAQLPTAIALETSKGDFAQGIALGAVLMAFALGVTALLAGCERGDAR